MIWSTTPLAIKWSGESVGFAFGVAARMILGGFFASLLSLVIYRKLNFSAVACRAYLAAGSGIFFSMSAVYWSAQFIPSGLISVIFGLCPMIVSLLATFWLKEHAIDRYKIFGMVLGFSGLLLVFQQQLHLGVSAATGIVMMIFAVIMHSVSSVWVKSVNAHLPALMITTGGLLFSILPFAGLMCWVDCSLPSDIPPRVLLSILYLSLVGSVIGFVMYYYVLAHLPAATVAMITLVAPIFALLLGRWLNAEFISAEVWLGAALVLGGLGMHIWGGRLFAALTGRLP